MRVDSGADHILAGQQPTFVKRLRADHLIGPNLHLDRPHQAYHKTSLALTQTASKHSSKMSNYVNVILILFGIGSSTLSFSQQIDASLRPPKCPHYDLMKRPGGPEVLQAYQNYLQYSHYGEIDGENGPMGILLLTEFINAEGKDCWQIECCYDDRYKDAVPVSYFFQRSGRFRLILLYKGNEKGEKTNPSLASSAMTRESLACFEEVVGNRVYLRPPRQQRIARILGKTSDMWVMDRVDYTGNIYHAVSIVFEPDGKFTATY